MAYTTDIYRATEENEYFRRVLFTTERSQLVVMSVLPGDDIGLEVHDLDQVLVFVSGKGYSLLAGERRALGPGTVVVVPAGVEHNIVNDGDTPLKLYTVYAPPEHADGTIHRTKAEADAAEAAEHGHGGGDGNGRPSGHAFTVGSLRKR